MRRAYADGCFRKSCCDPLTRVNTGDNTPAVLYTEIVPGDRVRVTVLPKGFGSENMSKLSMLTPAAGKEGIVNAVVSAVRDAGSRPCPPVIVGVGVGGTFDKCAYLAKRRFCARSERLRSARTSGNWRNGRFPPVNALQIGAQGFGGDITALSVAIEVLPTHIAGLPWRSTCSATARAARRKFCNMVKKIRLPEDAPLFGSLKAGDRVLLSGVVYTARDAAHRRLTEMMKKGEPLPFALAGQTHLLRGPLPAPGGKKAAAAAAPPPATAWTCSPPPFWTPG